MRLLLILLLGALLCTAQLPTSSMDPSTSPPSPTIIDTSSPAESATPTRTPTPPPSPALPSITPVSTTVPPGTKVIIVVSGGFSAGVQPPAPPPPPVTVPPDRRWIITVLTSICVPINATFTLWASWLSIPAARIVVETYPGCPILTKRTSTNVLKLYILLDDGTLTNQLGPIINARGGNNIISASVSLETLPGEPTSKGGSTIDRSYPFVQHTQFKYTTGGSLILVITIVASVIAGALLVAAVVLAYVFYRYKKSSKHQPYNEMNVPLNS